MRHLSREEKQERIKNLPRVHNPLLHRWMSMEPEDFELLFIDMRLHQVCVSLMEPDPRKRADYTQLMQHPAYKYSAHDSRRDLETIVVMNFSSFYPSPPQPTHWGLLGYVEQGCLSQACNPH